MRYVSHMGDLKLWPGTSKNPAKKRRKKRGAGGGKDRAADIRLHKKLSALKTELEHHLKNPVRPTKKSKKAAKKLVLTYGKARAKKVAGGMIGKAKTRKQKEHFVRVKKSINPKKRKYSIVRKVFARKTLHSPWKIACRVAGNMPDDVKKKCIQVAGKLAEKGWYVKYET